VEDGENLYINFTNVPQNVWCWALVREADLRNVVPRHGGPECPYGDKTGKGKSFRNLVFHLLDADKGVDEPAVYLDNLVIYSGADTNAPVMRGAPALVAKAGERFLVWADARDDVGVAYYEVARFAEAGAAKPLRVARVVAPEFALDGAAAWYKVSPVDYAGNVGAASDAVAVPAANRE
jgi:hypothetical protein